MKLVSIIIPVYNGEKFINRCVDSLLSQTYKNFEVILVNDGSTDNSLKIIKEYSKKYENIICINQNNQGASIARNNGIKKAKGQYIMFVDIDDYVEKDYVKKLQKTIKNNDVCISGFNRVVGDKIIYSKIPKNVIWSAFKYTSTWGKIYKTDFIKENKISFLNDYKIGEDLYFNITVLSKTNKISILEYAGYNYYDNAESLTNTVNKNKNKRNTQMFDLLNNMNVIFKNKNKQSCVDNKTVYYFFLKTIIFYLLTQRGILNNKEYYMEYKKYFEFLEKIADEYIVKEKIFNMKGEEFKVNFICNLFIFFRKIKLDRLLLNLINNIKIGRVQ